MAETTTPATTGRPPDGARKPYWFLVASCQAVLLLLIFLSLARVAHLLLPAPTGTIPKVTHFRQALSGTCASLERVAGTRYRLEIADRSTEGPRFDDLELQFDVANLHTGMPAFLPVRPGMKAAEIEALGGTRYLLNIRTTRPLPDLDHLELECDTAYPWPPPIDWSKTRK